MHIQLISLAILALFLSLCWVPSAIFRISEFGLKWPYIQLEDNVGKPLEGMGRRIELAHRHLLINFAPFGSTVMILAKLDISDSRTQTGCILFVCLRLAHYIFYVWDFPQLRSGVYFGSLLTLFYLSGRAIQGCWPFF